MLPARDGCKLSTQKDWIDYRLIAAILLTGVLLGAANWSLGKTEKENPPARSAGTISPAPAKPPRKQKPISGRQLTIEKMQRPKIPTQHFEDDVYGVAFDTPKGYVLKEGDLPEMDLGLGYLGSLPMEFAEPGGVRVATVEVPRNAYPGTDFVNAFLTVSAFPNTTQESCARFRPASPYAEPPLRVKLGGIEFAGIPNSESASMHQYTGKYFHGFAEGTCYEVGYGIVTADATSQDGLKKVNNQAVLHRLENILNTIQIVPLENGRNENDPGSATLAPGSYDKEQQ
jgi:hypothetical protein